MEASNYKGPVRFRSNDKTHPAFGRALWEAAGSGGVYAYGGRVAPVEVDLAV